jgi:hypothetical protein
VLLTFPGSGRRDRQILRVKGSTCAEVKMTSIESGYAQHYGACGEMIPRKAVKGMRRSSGYLYDRLGK